MVPFSIKFKIPINVKSKEDKDKGLRIGFLKDGNNTKPTNPVIVPKAVRKVATKKAKQTDEEDIIENNNKVDEQVEVTNINDDINDEVIFNDIVNLDEDVNNTDLVQSSKGDTINEDFIDDLLENSIKKEENVKKRRGRPKKILTEEELRAKENSVKRGRGRPKKQSINNTDEEETSVLPGFN